MPNSLSQRAGKASWTLFQGLFIVAAFVAVFATFIAISGADPDDPGAGATPWLLGLNFLVIGALATIVFREYMAMRREGRGEGRLAKRFVLLFGFSALIPTAIVAIFLGLTITRGLENWMGDRVDTIMTKTQSVSRNYIESFTTGLELDTRLAALDVEVFAQEVEENLATGQDEDAGIYDQGFSSDDAAREFREGLQRTMLFKGFLTVVVLGADGKEILIEQSLQDPIFLTPPASAFEDADRGEVGSTLYESSGYATALFKINAPVDGYVYTVKGFDKNVATQLREAEQALIQYDKATQRGGRLQRIFMLGYAQIAALILLLAGWLGLEAASRVTVPIGRLASAAMTVRDGDLTVRVPASGPKDEVRTLTDSFNAMTEQLGEQRGALIKAREDAEDRRQFVETLLAEVSAGVIRTDGDLVVTLANRSACQLLGIDAIDEGTYIEGVAPQFQRFVRDTIERDAPVDASIDFEVDGEIRHIRLKTALDAAGGCVLTFDDTTRLANAQRQLAWRDVARRIAHEIRNPLTPIMLSTERLKRRYGKQIDDQDGVFERCVETILRQVGDIGRMVEEFSSFARMPKPSVAPFDMVATLRGAGFSQSMVSPDVEINVTADADDSGYVGDERLLGQAFGNLVKNAAEAIEGLPESDEIVGRISISLVQSDIGLEITIEDNGPGFPEDVRDKLLEPYVTTREKGTGLGLAIVNRIIADHGGSISLQNRLDGLSGARVRVLLPYPDPEDVSASQLIQLKDTNLPTPTTVEEPTQWP